MFVNGTAHAEDAAESTTPSDARINSSLDEMAKLFASAVTSEQVRHDIHHAVAQRFDGDTEVLWEDLSEAPNVDSALAASYGANRSMLASDAGRAVDDVAAQIPRFQVAVPSKFDDWDPVNEVPLVGYVPEGIDDLELETINAYDASGKAHKLDAWAEPAEPIIVLGVNERTDDSGNLLDGAIDSAGNMAIPKPDATSPETESPQAVAAAASNWGARIVRVKLVDNKEPIIKGKAEIAYAAASTCGDLLKDEPNVQGLDLDGEVITRNIYLGTTRCDVVIYWWENDSGNIDFTLSYAGVSLGVGVADSDDLIGGILLDHNLFEGGTNDRTAWSALVMKTD